MDLKELRDEIKKLKKLSNKYHDEVEFNAEMEVGKQLQGIEQAVESVDKDLFCIGYHAKVWNKKEIKLWQEIRERRSLYKRRGGIECQTIKVLMNIKV